jgi:transcriptional regulator with GAF, ATPase, and Fis domain
VIGRAHPAWEGLDDAKLSREHACIEVRERRMFVRDLGSRNKTFVDGEALGRDRELAIGATLRVGHSLLMPVADVTPFEDLTSFVDGDLVLGPAMRQAFDLVRLHGLRSRTLMIRGETGTGKELAARRFWSARPVRGPFITSNCAAIPSNLAERLLFGAVRGAFSGAETQDGLVQAAAGGVLFLDEVGELPLDVQAKLLRVLETGEVTMLGDTRTRVVDLAVCFATHRDLKQAVAAGTFRADLYYRIARPEIELPPLRDRRDEISALVAEACRAAGRAPTASLVEACLLRPWPGNVRELRSAIHDACLTAEAERRSEVTSHHLADDAGAPIDAASTGPDHRSMTRAELERAVTDASGNIAEAARRLGLHRTQLYRLMKKHGLAH